MIFANHPFHTRTDPEATCAILKQDLEIGVRSFSHKFPITPTPDRAIEAANENTPIVHRNHGGDLDGREFGIDWPWWVAAYPMNSVTESPEQDFAVGELGKAGDFITR